jgi:hypothetical protein
MRRAIRWFALAACILACFLPTPGRTSKASKETINGVGLIDFGAKPTFKVGDWARYHITGSSEQGVSEEYDVTLMVGGEEQWWGEDCFWVETWTAVDSTYSQSIASLMSYDVFSDTAAFANMQLYVRKLISGLDDDGNADQVVFKRASSGLKTRSLPTLGFMVKIDTLGSESVTVPKGAFDCRKVRFTQGRGATGAFGDSTDYTELREVRTSFMNRKIPITHIVREDVRQAFTRRAWKVGYSKDAKPTVTLNSSLSSAQLVDFGSGLEARMVPPRLRKSIAEQRAEIARPRAPARPPARKKTG